MAGRKMGRIKRRRLWIPLGLILLAGISGETSTSPARTVPVIENLKERPELTSSVMPQIDRTAWLAEDEIEEAQGLPFRFGAPFETDLGLENSGSWTTMSDGGRLWLLRIQCSGAYSINLIYSRFHLPEGATLFVYNDDVSFVLGPFTADNNKLHGQFSTAPVPGESCVIEYYEPAGVAQPGELTVGRVVHGYRDVFAVAKGIHDFGESGLCNININCPEGIDWQQEKRSVAMVITHSGNRLCSGTLINNARQDMTPYFLTAHHCLLVENSWNTWVLMFNYESPNCDSIEGPDWMTVSGTTLIACNSSSDFALMELQETPPDSLQVYYAGWSALDVAPDSTVCIHHPSGDIKKISFDYDPATTSEQLGDPGTGLDYWRIGQWEAGTTEGGSSGSPLFDYEHHIIGQLYGGWASCEDTLPDWFGRFSRSWLHGVVAEERLMDWLDPDSIGLAVLNGRDSEGITIYHVPDSYTGDSLSGWEVRALIVSNCRPDLDSLRLWYEIDNTGGVSPLTPSGLFDEYVGSLPANPDGALITYHFTARDSCGQSASSATFHIGTLPNDSAPAIAVSPMELSRYILPDQSTVDTIYITNEGRVALTYNVGVESGTGWLTVLSPTEGVVDSAMSDTVIVSLNSAGLAIGDYGGYVVIGSNDPDPGDNPWSTPVTLLVREWLCGDVNNDGKITLSDVARLIDYVYLSRQPLLFEASGNVDGSPDELITLADIIHLVYFLYQDGAPLNCDYGTK